MTTSIKKWFGECLRKKKLKEAWADNIIARAAAEGAFLRKYFCPHCSSWHVSKQSEYKNKNRDEYAKRFK
jgi:hypothetical protein